MNGPELDRLMKNADYSAPLCLFDPRTGRILRVNEAAVRLSGYSREEMLGHDVRVLFDVDISPGPSMPPSDVPPNGADEIPLDVLTALPLRLRTLSLKLKDGSFRTAEVISGDIAYKSGPARLVVVLRPHGGDGSANDRETALQHIRAIVDQAPVMAWSADDAGNMIWFSQGWLRFIGRGLHDELKDGWLDHVVDEDRAAFRESFLAAVRERQPFQRECRVAVGDAPRWLACTGLPRFSQNGQVLVGYIGVFQDVTERHDAVSDRDRAMGERDAALREVDRLLRALGKVKHEQHLFLHDVLLAATDDRFHLRFRPSHLPAALPLAAGPFRLTREGLSDFRAAVRKVAEQLDFSEERWFDLVVAAGEASMNAVDHAYGAEATICADADAGILQIWVKDHGPGIDLMKLPRAVLQRGYSGDGGFGYGFWMVINACDRIDLLTRPSGTTIVLEQNRHPVPRPIPGDWLAALAGTDNGSGAPPPGMQAMAEVAA